MANRFIGVVSALSFVVAAMLVIPAAMGAEKQFTERASPLVESVKIGGITYSKAPIIWDFTKVAFSDALWLEDSGTPWQGVEDIKEAQARGSKAKLPRHNAISKWTEDVTISVQIPEKKLSKDTSAFQQFKELAENQAKSLSSVLQEAIKLPVRVIPITEEETKANQAKIRIIAIASTGETGLKVVWRDTRALSGDARSSAKYLGGIPFTHLLKDQVSGVLVADDHNNLKTAFCRIPVDLKPDLTKALVTECIVRSLGIPEVSFHEAVLPRCAPLKNPNASDLRLLGDGCYIEAAATKEEDTVDILGNWNKSSFAARPVTISSYDKFMLSLLYCPAVQPGMDKLSVISVLYGDTPCFNQIK